MDIASIFRLIALAAIWGGSFLFLRIGAPVFGPGVLIELRVGLAAVFLWLVCRMLGRHIRLLQHWRYFLVIGLLNSALPFLLFAYAAQTLSASLLSILNSSAPIFGAIIAAFWLRQPVGRSAALGLLLGMVGVATLVAGSPMVAGDGWWLAVAAGLAAPFCYGLASAYTKQSPIAVDPTDNAHGSMWAAAILVLPVALWQPIRHSPAGADWMAVGALAIVCTGAAYLMFFRLIADVGPMRALSVTFLIPVFGVLWGALFLGETIGWSKLFGGALVLCGTALANGMIRLPRPAPAGS
ncbi:DMT family transporter [Herminiimonas sp. CN]|uniref:DMT family transporter n=1 Tax=Herminiimonas sp. CN TaxID=1349818 RepID=UPI0004730B07|nr:DMT family transporter [Herminiimonas sp. CN]